MVRSIASRFRKRASFLDHLHDEDLPGHRPRRASPRRRGLFSGAARFVTYPLLGLFFLAASAKIVDFLYPHALDFLRYAAKLELLRESRGYDNRPISKFVGKVIEMRRRDVPPGKILSYLKENQALSGNTVEMLGASGIPVDRALDYLGKGLSANETLKRLQSEGVSLSGGYDALKRQGMPVQEFSDALKRQGVPVQELMERATSKK